MSTGIGFVLLTTFLASSVEAIEMVTIVVGVGATRGWRATIIGTGAYLGYGVFLANGTLYNGSLNNGAALIEGAVGAAVLRCLNSDWRSCHGLRTLLSDMNRQRPIPRIGSSAAG